MSITMMRLLLSAGPVLAAIVLGQLATIPNLRTWHAHLAKPSFNPPNWIFGPVWTTLYALMAISVWRVLGTDGPQQRFALGLYFTMLAFNIAWSWMFFAGRSPFLGLCNIVPQWLLVIATMLHFWHIDPLAGVCLLPLVWWVGFATLLNFEIWRLNR